MARWGGRGLTQPGGRQWGVGGATRRKCASREHGLIRHVADGRPRVGRDRHVDRELALEAALLDGKLLGVLGRSGKRLKQFGWIHEMACPAENTLYVAELLNWRIQKLALHG